jgi:drug/metabolite transporter (DMT)-like permease
VSPRGWILFALLSVVWGVPYLLIKIAVVDLPVPVLVFGRVAMGAALLMPLALRGGQLERLRGHAAPLVAFATLEFIIPWGLLSHAEIRITSSTAGLLMASIPILAMGMSRIAGDREPIGVRRSIGFAAGFAGVVALALPNLGGDLLSIAEVLLAAVC